MSLLDSDVDAIPLPPELANLSDHETCCKYCGISYLVYNEFRKLSEQKVKLVKDLKKSEEERERMQEKVDAIDALVAASEDAKKQAESRVIEMSREIDDLKQVHTRAVQEATNESRQLHEQVRGLIQQLGDSHDLFESFKSSIKKSVVDQLAVIGQTVSSSTNMLERVKNEWQSKLPVITSTVHQIGSFYDVALVNTRAEGVKRATEEGWRLQDEQKRSARLSEDVDRLNSQLNESRREYMEYKVNNDRLLSDSDEAQSRLRGDLVDAGLRIKSMDNRISELENDVNTTSNTLKQEQASHQSEVRKMKQELVEVTATLDSVRDDIAQSREDRIRVEKEKNVLSESIILEQQNVQEWKNRYETCEITLKELKEASNGYIEEVFKLRTRIEFLEREVETRQEALDEETVRWKIMEKSHRNQLGDVQSGLSERLAAVTRQSEERIAELEKKCESVEEDKMALTAKLEGQISTLKYEHEQCRERSTKSIDDLEINWRSKFDKQGAELIEWRSKCVKLTEELKPLMQDTAEVEQLQERVRQLETTILSKNSEIDALQLTVHAECEERQELSAVIGRLQGQLSQQQSVTAPVVEESPVAPPAMPVKEPKRVIGYRGRGGSRGGRGWGRK